MTLAEHPTVRRFRETNRPDHAEPPRPLDAAWLRQLCLLAKERSLLWALLRRRICIKGSPQLLAAFAKCFPS